MDKELLKKYVQQRFNGEIVSQEFNFFVGQRKAIIENNLLESGVLSKIELQKGVNAALNVLSKTVLSAVTI